MRIQLFFIWCTRLLRDQFGNLKLFQDREISQPKVYHDLHVFKVEKLQKMQLPQVIVNTLIESTESYAYCKMDEPRYRYSSENSLIMIKSSPELCFVHIQQQNSEIKVPLAQTTNQFGKVMKSFFYWISTQNHSPFARLAIQFCLGISRSIFSAIETGMDLQACANTHAKGSHSTPLFLKENFNCSQSDDPNALGEGFSSFKSPRGRHSGYHISHRKPSDRATKKCW